MDIGYLKGSDTLYDELNPIGPFSGLSDKILCILVAQGAVKLLKVNFGGLKKKDFSCPLACAC